MQAYTHFRSVFDISPSGSLENPWPALIGEVRAWVSRKEKAELKGFFFNGGSWAGGPPTRARVETRTLSDGDGTPEMWAVRYEHLDSEVPSRRWTTNVGVNQVGPREWRMAVELVHRLRPDYVGREPSLPQPSSPRLVTGLLESQHWICRVGSLRLTAHPVPMKVGKGPEFAALLRNANRLVPVVLVSCDRKTGVPKLDTVSLSRALAGTAVVYVCESKECDDEIEHFVPMRFRSPNGTVRIYAPGVDFSQDWTAGRHRFFHPKDIDEMGDNEVNAQIVRALTRSDAWRGLQSSITSIDDIEARVRERRLTELRQSGSGSLQESREMLGLFEAENTRLEAEKKKLTEDLATETGARERAEEALARREYDLEQIKASADETREAERAEKVALQAVRGLDEWPEGPEAIADLAGKIHRDRLVLTPAALRSLGNSEFSTCTAADAVLWRCLRVMATELYDLVMQDPPAQNAADLLKSRTKFELTWTETKETKRDNKLMAKRRMVYEGRDIDITPHLKWGNKAPRLLRVHFYVDRDQKKLVIGHCGDHLDTHGTRRRG